MGFLWGWEPPQQQREGGGHWSYDHRICGGGGGGGGQITQRGAAKRGKFFYVFFRGTTALQVRTCHVRTTSLSRQWRAYVQREDKNILQRSQLGQHGEFRKTVLATNVEESDRAMAADGITKVLVSPPPR